MCGIKLQKFIDFRYWMATILMVQLYQISYGNFYLFWIVIIKDILEDCAKNMLIYSKITNFIAILWIIHMSHVAKQTDLIQPIKKILRILTDDAWLSIAEISEQIHLSPTPTIRRIKRLWGYWRYHRLSRCYQSYGTWLRFIGLCCGSMDKRIPLSDFMNLKAKSKISWRGGRCSVVTGRSEDYLLKYWSKTCVIMESFITSAPVKIEGRKPATYQFCFKEVFHQVPPFERLEFGHIHSKWWVYKRIKACLEPRFLSIAAWNFV